MPPKKASYTDTQVDELLIAFEKCCQRQAANKSSAVRLRAAERELLNAAEKTREVLSIVIRTDKAQMSEVFGGNANRLERLHVAIEATELSDGFSKDGRWGALADSIATVEEMLENIGRYKPWSGVKKPPETLAYSLIVTRLTPGETIELYPTVTGCEIAGLTFESIPMLPQCLELRRAGGDISGQLLPGMNVPERTYSITATNVAGECKCQLTFGVRDPAPEHLRYPDTPEVVYTGDIMTFRPRFDGGSPITWVIKPNLPKGIEIDKLTGVIRGAGREPCEDTGYMITAKNLDGEAKATINFRVQIAPPEQISYPEVIEAYPERTHVIPFQSATYLSPDITLHRRRMSILQVAKWGRVHSTSGAHVGTKWARARQAVISGKVARLGELPKCNFTVFPDLPEGLAISSKTGIISGTANEETQTTAYKISCSNDGGSANVTIRLKIKMLPPTALKYPEAVEILFTGVPVSLEPEVFGLVTGWEMTPELPAGLMISGEMGSISGTPTEKRPMTTYTVTASNAKGQATAELAFACQRPAPKNIQYRTFQLQYALGRSLEILRPAIDGEVDKYSITPDLPTGLLMDEASGDIRGTPTLETEVIAYEVVAENESGSARVTLTFSVLLLPPKDITFPRVDDAYGLGEQILLEPEYKGGGGKWEIEPPLPEGMTIDATTGVISGAASSPTEEVSYTVSAENEAGGTAVQISFAICPEPPEGLEYPDMEPKGIHKFMHKEPVLLEPTLRCSYGAKFSVDHELPHGMHLDPDTGVISGTPDRTATPRVYKIKAQNASGFCECQLRFSVMMKDDKGNLVTQSFAQMLEEVTDIAELPPNPTPDAKGVDWQLWMSHRVHLNDPSLEVLDFNHVKMPPPHQEPRIAPKMFKALLANSVIKTLKLQSANVHKPQGAQLADVLRMNGTLENVDISSNHLDAKSMESIGSAISDNDGSQVHTLRVAGQVGVPDFGRRCEKTFAEMAQKRSTLLKLNFDCKDPHWLNTINRAIMSNNDQARRERRTTAGLAHTKEEATPEPKAAERPLAKMFVERPPDKAAWEIYEDDNWEYKVVRHFVSQKKKLPKADQLKTFAVKIGSPLKYKSIAPLINDFREKMLAALVNCQVYMFEGTAQFHGTMREYSVKNNRSSFDLWTKQGVKIIFNTSTEPVIEVSDIVAAWISPGDDDDDEGETRVAEDGGAYTKAEFIQFFGDEQGGAKWIAAQPAM